MADAIFADTHILPFPALVWAVVEKNPGLNPSSYLEQFRRRTLTPEDAAYLRFTGAYSVEDAAQHFRRMIAAADTFIAANTRREPGALLQDRRTGSFFLPRSEQDWSCTREHRGALGGSRQTTPSRERRIWSKTPPVARGELPVARVALPTASRVRSTWAARRCLRVRASRYRPSSPAS